jgi:hypothetical protein
MISLYYEKVTCLGFFFNESNVPSITGLYEQELSLELFNFLFVSF